MEKYAPHFDAAPIMKDFIRIFYRDKKDEMISEKVAETLACLIDTLCILLRKKDIRKISLSELIERSGYSRTTFYKYFRDIYDLEDTLKEILLYHFDYFSEAYYTYLSAVDSGALEDVYQDIIPNMSYFELFMHEPEFFRRFKEALRIMFERHLPEPQTADPRSRILFDYMKECLLSYNTDIIMYYYKNPAHPSLADHLRYAQTIGHELMKIFQKIEKNEL